MPAFQPEDEWELAEVISTVHCSRTSRVSYSVSKTSLALLYFTKYIQGCQFVVGLVLIRKLYWREEKKGWGVVKWFCFLCSTCAPELMIRLFGTKLLWRRGRSWWCPSDEQYKSSTGRPRAADLESKWDLESSFALWYAFPRLHYWGRRPPLLKTSLYEVGSSTYYLKEGGSQDSPFFPSLVDGLSRSRSVCVLYPYIATADLKTIFCYEHPFSCVPSRRCPMQSREPAAGMLLLFGDPTPC